MSFTGRLIGILSLNVDVELVSIPIERFGVEHKHPKALLPTTNHRLVSNSVGGGCSLDDGQNLQVDCWSSYDFNCLGVGSSVELGGGVRVVVDVLSWS